MDLFKKKVSKFKETGLSTVLFIVCAVFPFFLTDIILRYVLNFMVVWDWMYYIVPVLFDAFWIFGLVYLCYGILPETIGKIIYGIIYFFFGILFFVNYIYFKIFGQFMWLKTIVLAGEGMDYIDQALPYINLKVIFVMILYIVFFIATLILWKRPVHKKRYLCAAIPFVLLVFLELGIALDTKIQIKKGAWETWERPVLVYKSFTDANKSLNMCGFYQFTFKSLYKTVFSSSGIGEEEKKECDAFFEEKAKTPANDMTGVLKDKNVIFVLMESMDDWIIDETHTPTIKYLMDNGIKFDNHFMPNVGSGYTFNAEFSMNSGFTCPSDVSSAAIFTSNSFPYAMPNVFKKDGYNPNSFHFNSRNFYNRKSMHTKMGYNDYYCLMDYMSIEDCVQDGEVVKNDTVYNHMTKDKFFSFFISYSCHLPYDKVDNKLKGAMEKYPELIDENLDEETKNVYLLARDTDEFFRLLIERLKEDGLYEDTVIIGVTDHYSYGVKDKEKLKDYSIASGSEIFEKVPFFIYSPSLKPQKVTKVTGAIDIVPTILNMFGFDTSHYIGNDAFNPDYQGYVYFPGGSWYDGEIYYKPNEQAERTDEEQKYIDLMNKKIIQVNRINDLVINGDYFCHPKKSEN